jgi:hypothetical protein
VRDEYVIRGSFVKVLKVTNNTDRVLRGVRVQVTASSTASPLLPHNLDWFHTEEQLADITPRRSAYAVLGMSTAMGISIDRGGSWDWIDLRGLMDPGEAGAIVTIDTWASEDIYASRTFRMERPYPFLSNQLPKHEWLPRLSYERVS